LTLERDALNLVQDNNFEDIHVTTHDIRRAFDIYGKPFESVRGKKTKKKVQRRTDLDLSPRSAQPLPQRMYSDVIAIIEQKFLMTLVEPLGLVLTIHVERETTEELGLALQGQLNVVQSTALPRLWCIWTHNTPSRHSSTRLQGWKLMWVGQAII
jgi:hypothetical protein